MPPIISKSAKNAVFRAKMGHFWPKNAWGVTELFFFLCQPLKLMKYANFHPFWLVKSIEMCSIITKSAKKAVFGEKPGQKKKIARFFVLLIFPIP